MEMHQVRYFLAVAQELNFSRAAESCNVSQPSLSRAIQQLEGELGGRPFHRERQFTHLTDLGQMVRPHLELVYNAAVKAKRLSQELIQLRRLRFARPQQKPARAAKIRVASAAVPAPRNLGRPRRSCMWRTTPGLEVVKVDV